MTSVYILDHQVVGSYTAPNVTEQLDHVVFWSASGLISTFHTMVVNITSASPDYPFLFDFIAFPYAAYTTPSVTLPSETVTSSSSTDGNTPSSRNDTAPFHRSNTGAIVGEADRVYECQELDARVVAVANALGAAPTFVCQGRSGIATHIKRTVRT